MLKPLSDRVIIKLNEVKEENIGGIVLAAAAKEQPQSGKVVAIGSGLVTNEGKTIPMNVKVGDTVVFDTYAGSKIEIDDEKYIVMHEKDIFAIETK